MASADSFVNLSSCKEVVTVLKKYIELNIKDGNSVVDEKTPKKKPLPLGDETEVDSVPPLEKVELQVGFKKIPLNKTTFINWLGPLPYPWAVEEDFDICLIVRDLNTKKSLPDRELDLQQTREHYQGLLLAEGTGLSPDLVNRRIYILTMRELLTEYKEPEAKSKLAAAYDIFIADKSLMNNKFKELNTFLGSKFWTASKKHPCPVDLSKRGDELGQEIATALEKTHFYVSGKGTTESVQVGIFKQTSGQISYNLEYVLKEIKKRHNENVGSLRLKLSQSGLVIPFYVDLKSANYLGMEDIGPKTEAFAKNPEIVDDFPMLNNVDMAVSATGEVKILPKNGSEEVSDADDEKDEDEEHVRFLEKCWIEVSSKKKHIPTRYIKVRRWFKRRHPRKAGQRSGGKVSTTKGNKAKKLKTT